MELQHTTVNIISSFYSGNHDVIISQHFTLEINLSVCSRYTATMLSSYDGVRPYICLPTSEHCFLNPYKNVMISLLCKCNATSPYYTTFHWNVTMLYAWIILVTALFVLMYFYCASKYSVSRVWFTCFTGQYF